MPGADPGILEWWDCMTNAREAHFIKTILILLHHKQSGQWFLQLA